MKTFLSRILMIVSITLFYFQANAQTFGVKGGLSFAKLAYDNDIDENSINIGLHLGVTADFPINDFLSFEPGIVYTRKGLNYLIEESGLELDISIDLNYLDLPLTVKGIYEITDGIKLYGAVGPYIGFGLNGKYKVSVTYQGQEESEEEDVDWGKDGDFKRMELGLTYGLGVELNDIILGLTYDRGLSNINADKDDSPIKNRVFKLSVGYRFGGY